MKHIAYLLFSVLFFCSPFLMGQTRIDSLLNALEKTPGQSVERVDILNQLGLEFWIIDSNRSLEFGKEANQMADQLDYTKGIGAAQRVLGVAHWTKGNMVAAIKELSAATKSFEEVQDEEGIANSLLNTGMVYADLKEYDKALALFEKSIDKFTILNKDNRVATAYTKIGTLYIDQEKYFEAKKYLDNALSIHSKNGFTYGLSEVHNRLGILFMKENNPEQAYYHIRKSITLGQNVNDKDGAVSNLIQYGILLRIDGEYRQANYHLKQGVNRAIASSLKKYELEAYKQLQILKKVEGKPDSSLIYYDKYVGLKDSLFNSEKTSQIATLSFENEIDTKEKEVQLLQEKERADSIIKWSLLGGVILITLAGLTVISSLRQKARKSKELGRQRQQLLASKEELARTALENAELKQQELEQKLDYKNKELTSYTLNFVQKNEFLQQIQKKVAEAKSATPKEKDKIIDSMGRDIKQYVTIDKDWEDFKRYFEDVHTDFFKKLKQLHPELSSNDLKISSLTRLNLNVKETANILGISPESAKTARYRLRKKLNLTPEQDLLDYFLLVEKQEIE